MNTCLIPFDIRNSSEKAFEDRGLYVQRRGIIRMKPELKRGENLSNSTN